MTFEAQIERRNAETYADFFYPHLAAEDRVLDCGCGDGSITVGLAPFVPHGSVVGIDLDADQCQPAISYAGQHHLHNVSFCGASILSLPFAPETFSACLCHSALETLADPVRALQEIKRVLKPDGLIGVAAVDYQGVRLAGTQEPLLRRFYAVRETLWQLKGIAEPRLGKHLRRLLHAAGFTQVQAQARYISYGSDAEVALFGRERAADCQDRWYVENALAHKLLSRAELEQIQAAWTAWAVSPDAFAAFTWCRAVGRKTA
jgi:ubiquinone/menaquinone biosynthesis C-methylase UbiE